jgi:hypothetical protein
MAGVIPNARFGAWANGPLNGSGSTSSPNAAPSGPAAGASGLVSNGSGGYGGALPSMKGYDNNNPFGSNGGLGGSSPHLPVTGGAPNNSSPPMPVVAAPGTFQNGNTWGDGPGSGGNGSGAGLDGGGGYGGGGDMGGMEGFDAGGEVPDQEDDGDSDDGTGAQESALPDQQPDLAQQAGLSDIGSNQQPDQPDPMDVIRQALQHGRQSMGLPTDFSSGTPMSQNVEDQRGMIDANGNGIPGGANPTLKNPGLSGMDPGNPTAAQPSVQSRAMARLPSTLNTTGMLGGTAPTPKQQLGFDDGGEVPMPGEDQQQGEQQGSLPDPRKTMAYLTGDGAVQPDVADALERQVDPQGQMDPAERKFNAILGAQTPETQFGLMQHYRTKANAYSGAARAALDQGNLAQAAQHATSAFANIPTGYKVQFAPARGGLVVQSSKIGSQQQQPQQQQGQMGFEDGGAVPEIWSGKTIPPTKKKKKKMQSFDDGGEVDGGEVDDEEDDSEDNVGSDEDAGDEAENGVLPTADDGYGNPTEEDGGDEPGEAPETTMLSTAQVQSLLKGGVDEPLDTGWKAYLSKAMSALNPVGTANAAGAQAPSMTSGQQQPDVQAALKGDKEPVQHPNNMEQWRQSQPPLTGVSARPGQPNSAQPGAPGQPGDSGPQLTPAGERLGQPKGQTPGGWDAPNQINVWRGGRPSPDQYQTNNQGQVTGRGGSGNGGQLSAEDQVYNTAVDRANQMVTGTGPKADALKERIVDGIMKQYTAHANKMEEGAAQQQWHMDMQGQINQRAELNRQAKMTLAQQAEVAKMTQAEQRRVQMYFQAIATNASADKLDVVKAMDAAIKASQQGGQSGGQPTAPQGGQQPKQAAPAQQAAPKAAAAKPNEGAMGPYTVNGQTKTYVFHNGMWTKQQDQNQSSQVRGQ